MAAHEVAAPLPQRQALKPKDRAKRLYADAALLERISTDERAKEIARSIALLALDMMVEARIDG